LDADHPGGHKSGREVRLPGADIELLKIKAFLFDTGGQPVGVVEGLKDNVSAGSIPFELELGDTMSKNIAKVEMAYTW
jgi:hypothetical protein